MRLTRIPSSTDEVPITAAESDLSSQGKPRCWKVISIQCSVEADSSLPLLGTGNSLGSYSSGHPHGDNTFFNHSDTRCPLSDSLGMNENIFELK